MARAIWKGTISFGLVNISVELFPVEKKSDLHFHLVDSRNNARIRYERVNDITGKEVPWDSIVKGYEFDDGNYVLLTDKDFERVAIEANKAVEIEDFVDAAKIPYEYFDKPYVLVPIRNAQKPYVVLREALKKTGRAGIAKVVIRTRQYLAAVLPHGDALYMFVLRFSNEVRKAKEFDLPTADPAEYKVSAKEVDLATQLVDSMSSTWKPEQYHDEYREALMGWIEKKAKAHGHVDIPEPDTDEPEPTTNIVNIMDLLKQSMKKGKPGASSRAEEPDEEEPPKRSSSRAKAGAKPKSKSKPATKRRAS